MAFNVAWRFGTVAREWQTRTGVPIFKKGGEALWEYGVPGSLLGAILSLCSLDSVKVVPSL